MQPNRLAKGRAFDRPRDIFSAHDLSPQQKIELLKEWEFDLRELQVASEENMTADTASGTTAELLRECRRVLAMLGAAADGDSGGAPTKQGGD